MLIAIFKDLIYLTESRLRFNKVCSKIERKTGKRVRKFPLLHKEGENVEVVYERIRYEMIKQEIVSKWVGVVKNERENFKKQRRA